MPRAPVTSLATVRDYDGLIEAMRARVTDLGISQAHVDELVGWADGMTGKVLGPSHTKKLTPPMMWLLLQALSLRCELQADPQLEERMCGRYQRARRNEKFRRIGNTSNALGVTNISRAAQEMGRRGGSMPKRLGNDEKSKKKRQQHARKASLARWHKPKLVEIKKR